MSVPASELKIAVLDDYNNIAPRYLKDLKSKADITVFRDTILPSLNLQGLVDRLKPYNVVCTMRERTPITKELLDSLPNLKILLTTAMRNKGIDMEACKAKGIAVAGTPTPPPAEGVPVDFLGTVQHTWALILSLTNNVPRDQTLITSGSWTQYLPINTYIGGRTFGVLGLGRLGMGAARIAHLAFGMKVIAYSSNLTQEKADQSAKDAGLPAGTVKVVAKDTLFTESDIVSVHYILSDRSRGLIGAKELGQMKSSAFLVNTSRGPIVDEKALLDTLEAEKIQGAALDVFDIEPLPENSKWRTTKWGQDGRSQVVMTPHTGYSFDNSMSSFWERTTENLQRLAEGREVQWRMDQ